MTEQDPLLFQNPVLDTRSLPSIGEISYVPLSLSYLRYSILSTLITFGILALPVASLWIAGAPLWVEILVTAIWGALFLSAVLLRRYQYRIKGYVLRKHDIVYRRGVIFRRVTTIPFSRIQHCEIQEGPLERLFKLNTLLVYTAGGSGSDLSIPGLPPPEAQRLRSFILQKVSDRQAEEEE